MLADGVGAARGWRATSAAGRRPAGVEREVRDVAQPAIRRCADCRRMSSTRSAPRSGRWSSGRGARRARPDRPSSHTTRCRGSRRAARHTGSSTVLAAAAMTLRARRLERIEQVTGLQGVEGLDPVALGDAPAAGRCRARCRRPSRAAASRARRQRGPDRGLATAHQPDQNDVRHRPSVRAPSGPRGARRRPRVAARRRAHDDPVAAISAGGGPAGIETSARPTAAHCAAISASRSPRPAAMPGDAVARHHGREDIEAAARWHERAPATPAITAPVQAQDATQQRTPRQRNGHEVRPTGEHGIGQRLGASTKKRAFDAAAAMRGAPGRLGHGGRGRRPRRGPGRVVAARARARTARPSPVPRSTTTRSARAIGW